MSYFKSPFDAELAKHGRRYGPLVHFVNEAIKYDSVKHLTIQAPGLHAFKTIPGEGRENVHDHNCLRCEMEKAIEHANRDGWVGLEWQGGDRMSASNPVGDPCANCGGPLSVDIIGSDKGWTHAALIDCFGFLKLQVDGARNALEQIRDRFMDVLKERGPGAFNYVDGGRMKDIAVDALKKLADKRICEKPGHDSRCRKCGTCVRCCQCV